MLRLTSEPKQGFHYLLEFILVIAGILIALQIDNWNEERKSRKLEKTTLQELQSSLQSDLTDVVNNINTHRRGQKASQEVLKELSSSEKIGMNSIGDDIFISIDGTFLIADVSTYEFLKSYGLHLITSDSLRNQIAKLYNVVYPSILGVEDNGQLIRERLINNLSQYLTANEKRFIPTKNFEHLKEDTELAFLIKTMELTHGNMLTRYTETVRPALETLITHVEKELNKF